MGGMYNQFTENVVHLKVFPVSSLCTIIVQYLFIPICIITMIGDDRAERSNGCCNISAIRV
jgi:hypothetical protein